MNIFIHFKTNIFAKDILNKPSFVLLIYFATSALKNLSLFFGKYIFLTECITLSHKICICELP